MMALLLMPLLTSSASTGPACRCVPPDPCWDHIPWSTLNESVAGRLHVSVDELAACIPQQGGNLSSGACAVALNGSNDEFWLTSRPNGYLHTGLFNEWNISTSRSEYSVLAETESDFQATIKFAHDHNLRLVVKNTGHDWYGRSTAAGSLLLWTHLRKRKAWHDNFVAEGCDASSAHPAVTVESGSQFIDLYPDAASRGRIVMGGTCDSVGVAGCWMAGCFGPFTKRFGNGAINILQARVVLADGTLVTASKCAHPDLFYSIRGGGGGVAGVVTEFVARTHPMPRHTSSLRVTVRSEALQDCKLVLAKALQASTATVLNGSAGALCDNNGMSWECNGTGGSAALSCQAYEGDPDAMRAQLQPLADWANAQGGGISASVSGGVNWNLTAFDPSRPTANFPPGMIEMHPDREISTALLASMSKYLPVRYMATADGAAALAEALVDIKRLLPTGQLGTNPFMGAKGQGGLDTALAAEFHTTSLNPVMLDAVGTWLIMCV
jgi:hypothetical protein